MLDGTRERLIFVLGKMDLLNDDERAAVTAYVKEGVARLAPGAPVFPLSARSWLPSARTTTAACRRCWPT
jgi:hypothetical protein